MSFAEFLHSVAVDLAPPPGLSRALQALWYDRRGQWDAAHAMAQEASGNEAAWVHGYLHRKKSDEENAEYWYRLAGKPMGQLALETEWEQIVRALLAAVG